jgi:hypothetical protein
MVLTKSLYVTIVDQWFPLNVKCQPLSRQSRFPSVNGGKEREVKPWKMIKNGKTSPVAADETPTMICLLSSTLWTLTCLEPLVSHVLAPPMGTRCMPV